ncbi:hypothetical protein [Actinoplanes sichuanensis]|uniref:MFS transporter n=1 Tax=Actinoplanes sichuanensis TaxID=512349 RepID=A0ABW4A3T9_9ACTN|nr:hypothetical protein [Actinoplanes sichuanensis]
MRSARSVQAASSASSVSTAAAAFLLTASGDYRTVLSVIGGAGLVAVAGILARADTAPPRARAS